MAKKNEKGFVRIVLKQVSSNGNEIFFDGPMVKSEDAFDTLDRYKECFNSNLIFDMLLVSGAHAWIPSNSVNYALYLPKSFLGDGSE